MTGRYMAGVGLMTAAALVTTWLAYPILPSMVATHWDVHGKANGFSPKWMLFLLGPGLLAATTLLIWLLPWLSPKSFAVEEFRPTFLQIMLMTAALLAYIYAIILWTALGRAVNIGHALSGGICLFFLLLGNLMGKVRRNFFIGIRTPWTLANERVWYATHRFAAKTMVAGGLVGLLITAAGFRSWPAIAAALLGALIPAGYSLYFYKQLERRGEL